MKTFTLDEAQSLLPILESLLKRAVDGKRLAEEKDASLQELRQRIFLSGGMQVNVIAVARQRAEVDKLVQQAKDAIAEIDSIGVQVKDLEMGLLDFPCLIDSEIVLLCWRMGESRIDFWHTIDAGFRGRQPLDERFGRNRSERPN
ncbi:DUF2203 domain-containing protein [Acidobacterium sp. S8]|uniref:DUF2203 domain-containing protein n=1 Tax=Acidobacterium sp. S8 TaxID=1641854 RepID=UPI00131C301F|nr:DUF2203 domain-containing protein [Acidobacterium sp. S8]